MPDSFVRTAYADKRLAAENARVQNEVRVSLSIIVYAQLAMVFD